MNTISRAWYDGVGVDRFTDYDVVKRPMFYDSVCGWQGKTKQAKDFALVHSETNEQLGTCRAGYEVFQNEQLDNLSNRFIDTGQYQFHRTGTFKKGAVCFIILKQGTSFIGGEDRVDNFLVLINAHTGHTGNYGFLMQERLICLNQLPQLKDGDNFHSIKHNRNILPTYEALEKYFIASQIAFKNRNVDFENMMMTKIDPELIESTASMLMPIHTMKDGKMVISPTKRKNRDLLVEFMNENPNKTRWDIYNSSTEFIQHRMSNKIKDVASATLNGVISSKIEKAFNWLKCS